MEQQKQQLASALRRYSAMQRDECFDPEHLDSRPTKEQEGLFRDIQTYPIRALVGANQVGKSQTGGREVSWMFQDNHPYFERPESWGLGPLTILVLGQVGSQIESNLWAKKIRPFLDTGCYKEVRSGTALQRVEHKTNGNTIIFISHHNANEARKTVQGYVANYVWIDEMPDSISLIAELETRIVARNARFLLTFTPLLQNIDIKNWVEALPKGGNKKYQFKMLDNPIFAGREEEILARYSKYPESERRARLYGEWYTGSNAVYSYNLEQDTEELPMYYSTVTWDHLEAIDPAAGGKAGYILMAQDPVTNVWHIIKALYLDGAAGTDLAKQCLIESAGYNVVRRVSDPHEVWFIKEAVKPPFNLSYMGVYNKQQRKLELIKNLQQSWTDGKSKISKDHKNLLQEIVGCRWSETAVGKIINSSKYHLLDAYQYAVDNLPTDKKVYTPLHSDPLVNHDMELRIQNRNRKEREYKQKMRIRRKR